VKTKTVVPKIIFFYMEIFIILVFTVWLTKIHQIHARSKVLYEPEFGVKSTHMHTSYSNLNKFFYLKFTKSKAFLKSKAIIVLSPPLHLHQSNFPFLVFYVRRYVGNYTFIKFQTIGTLFFFIS
jgi:hypothetical protein